jgi:hypothetical protein
MTFTQNIDHFRQKRYQLAGQLVQWSITQGGPGLPCLSVVTYELMAGLPPQRVMLELEHISDTVLKDKISKVCSARYL